MQQSDTIEEIGARRGTRTPSSCAAQSIEITKNPINNGDFIRFAVSIRFNPFQSVSTENDLPVFYAESQRGAS